MLSCTALTAKVTELWPAGITTDDCTVASVVSLLLRCTVRSLVAGVLRVSVAVAAPAPADSASTLLDRVSDSVGPSLSVISSAFSTRVLSNCALVNWSVTAAEMRAVWSPSASVLSDTPMSKSMVATPAPKVT